MTIKELAARVLALDYLAGTDAARLARAVLAAPAVESAPAASGWRKEPPTVEERAKCTRWWKRLVSSSGKEVWNKIVDSCEDHEFESTLEVLHFEWAPCLPPSAPAADAGIVARPYPPGPQRNGTVECPASCGNCVGTGRVLP